MNKKVKIPLIIILTIAIVLSIIVIFLKIFYKPTTNESFNKLLDETISSIEEINSKITSENLEKKTSYIIKEVLECRKYIGNDKEEYINLIKGTYVNPFYEYNIFNLVKSEETEELYICLTKECKLDTIDKYNIETEEETTKVISINEYKYKMEKIDNTWKFIYPVVLCQKD